MRSRAENILVWYWSLEPSAPFFQVSTHRTVGLAEPRLLQHGVEGWNPPPGLPLLMARTPCLSPLGETSSGSTLVPLQGENW